MNLFDIFFPKRCVNCKKFGDFLCTDCFSKISYNQSFQCPVCLRPAMNGMTHPGCLKKYSLDGVIPTVIYKGVVKKLLYQFKYFPYLSKLSENLSEILYEGLIQNEFFYKTLESSPVFMPVPLHPARYRMRGYNHAALLAKNLSKKLGYPYVAQYLVRTVNTKPQYKLKKDERTKNIRGAFAIKDENSGFVKGKTIILVDDIATSFATLSECAKVLKRDGAAIVLGITLAKEASS